MSPSLSENRAPMLAGKAIDRWNDFWFPETTAVRLAVCRIVVVGSWLLFFGVPLETHLHYIRVSDGFVLPQAMISAICALVPVEVFRTVEVITVLYWVTMAAAIGTLVGLMTRPAAFVFALGNLVLTAHSYSYGSRHHPDAILSIFLMLLAFAPSGRCLSIDAVIRRRRNGAQDKGGWGLRATMATAMWPLKVTQVLIALAYLNAGLCKFYRGGLEWLNGYTLQSYLLMDAVRWDRPLGLWLAQQHELAILLSIGTVCFETFFFLTLFWRRAVPVFLVGGVLVHVGIYLAMAAPFFQLLVLYSVFIEFDRMGLVKLDVHQPADIGGRIVEVVK